jgi:hypothetical protein
LKFTCTHTTGDGKEIDEGTWEVKTKTDKTLILEKVMEGSVFEYYEVGSIIKCGRLKQNGNTLREWSDGTLTIYPNQCGTPFYFEQVNQ